MLIHKASRGVLAEITVPGPNGVWRQVRNLKLSMFPELDPAEWFEVRDNSAIAIKSRMHYPNIRLIEVDGQLVDVEHVPPVDENIEEVTEYDSQE